MQGYSNIFLSNSCFSSASSAISSTVKNKMIIIGPKTIPLNENSFTPPSIEKKIKKGCILILSFKKNGRKRLSSELIPSPATTKKTTAFSTPEEKKSPIPTRNHTQLKVKMN